jgi:hypothetical protein
MKRIEETWKSQNLLSQLFNPEQEKKKKGGSKEKN